MNSTSTLRLLITDISSSEREIEEAHDKHLIDQERRAKIALQRAINRINVGNRL